MGEQELSKIPDFESSVRKLSSRTRYNLLFSFNLDNILKHLDDGYAHKNYVEVEWMKQIRSDFVRAEQVDKALNLTDIAVVNRTFIFGDKRVSSVPDLAYGFASRPVAVQKNVLFSVVEVEGKPVNNDMSECLEDQLDSDVLGRVGSELFAVVPHSVMFPNSLGIICMGTKIIFVYLKIKREPGELLILPLNSKGIIQYTRPFDILKAQDRGDVCFTQVWIGLTDIVDEDIYVYPSDGAKSVYLNWNIGQPSGGKGENCAALRTPFQKWHDFPCNNNVSYICKKPAKHFV
uniref:Brevican core protein n=1 Tax=Magallana gigas TaxID=29159 RepID=K1QP25_MAGGI